MTTVYHSKFWAHALTLKGSSDSIDNLSRSISNARVDLNPHQVDAALFALKSPLSKGAILADEVGLGKTIEACLVMSQRWAERQRRILIILPASLRRQWQQELEEKFFLPSVILESRNFNGMQGEGFPNPFEQKDAVVICSYHFASAKAAEIRRVDWDLVVIDEAHRMRNIYKPSTKMARRISESIGSRNKLLLTATPLQNSLLELYGLVSIIDPHVFGDQTSFRDQFIRGMSEQSRNRVLRERLNPVCIRTLRKQVLEYIRFTQRIPITQDFFPTNEEQELYDDVSEYLRRDVLLALPVSQRSLMTMVLRKLLASSTFAIAGTLRRLVQRLETLEPENDATLDDDYESLEEVEDEWGADAEELSATLDRSLLQEELSTLRQYAALAERIAHNAKGTALVEVLEPALDQAEQLGAQRKAVVFTESRRTQQYLRDLLAASGYEGQIVTLNGTNNDPHSREIYNRWRSEHPGGGSGAGSRAVDIKTAIIEEFRDCASIMIATEAAAEGVNLQFCSLVINYDLPWNPQRIEQRIGRCHRYGQQHDVVVVNFLNRRNAADQRVFQLLSEKFRLFDGVFGASDELLGALESGVDLEKRIAEVYQSCRTPEEIEASFDRLQAELDAEIQHRMDETRRVLLEHFDEEVHERLQFHQDQTMERLSDRERWLLSLTRFELQQEADFDEREPYFWYQGDLAPGGYYHLNWKSADRMNSVFYRTDHPLAIALIEKAKERNLCSKHLVFSYHEHGAKISDLEPLVGTQGWLELSKLTVEALDTEEFLAVSAVTDRGERIGSDIAMKLLNLPARVCESLESAGIPRRIDNARKHVVQQRLQEVDERNARFVDEEVAKLDRWSDDLKLGLERELRDLNREIKEAQKATALSANLSDKLTAQKRLRNIERRRSQKRRDIYAAEDKIDEQRAELIGRIERQLKQTHEIESLFTVRWTLT